MSLTVVVGHGRSPEGKGWGPRIDAAGCVVRMWNHGWQDPADYGSRYDYGLHETHRSVLLQWRKHCTRHPTKAYVVSILERYRNYEADFPAGSIFIDQYNWLRQEGKAIKGIGETGKWELTRGSIAACWAITRAKHDETIILSGFDNVYGGRALPTDAAFSAAYQADPAAWPMDDYGPGKTKNGNHDFPAERRLIELMARRKGIVLHFSQDIWQ
jgi:hypothetical protein